jgi:hypothetical protein
MTDDDAVARLRRAREAAHAPMFEAAVMREAQATALCLRGWGAEPTPEETARARKLLEALASRGDALRR